MANPPQRDPFADPAVLRPALDAAEIGVWHLDQSADAFSCCARMAELLGLKGAHMPLTHENCLQRFHPDDRSLVAAALDFSRDNGSKFTVEARTLHSGEGTRLVRLDGVPMPIERIPPDVIVGTCVDITDIRQAEIAVAEQHEMLQTVADSLPEMVAYVTPHERYAFVNSSYGRRLNVDPRELIGKTLEEGLGEAYSQVKPHLKKALAGQQTTFDVTISTGDKPTTHSVTYVPNFDVANRVVGITKLAIDVTQHKVHAEKLEKRDEMRANVIDLLYEVAKECHAARTINQALAVVLREFSQFNGWAFGHAFRPSVKSPGTLVPVRSFYEDVPGRFEHFRKITYATSLKFGEGLPGRVWQSKQMEYVADIERELVALRAEPAKKLGIGAAIAFPVMLHGKVALVLEFFADHHRKPEERALNAFESVATQLSVVIERRQLEQQLADASATEQLRIAQDLHDTAGQELTGLSYLAQGLADALADESAHATSAARIADGIRDSLSTIRSIIRGVAPIQDREGGLSSGLERLAESIRHAHEINCTLEVKGDDSQVSLKRATQLFHIAQEATNNAARHAEASRIGIVFECRDDGRVILVVEDNGNGIDNSSGKQHGGGMGLRIMQHRAALLGGELTINSEPDRGTRVCCVVD
jgi:signal transduction histidine kinase/PAS domain-containing protein